MNNGAFGENFPYTNFHDLNTDWLIKTFKEVNDKVDTINSSYDQVVEVRDEVLVLKNQTKDYRDQTEEYMEDAESFITSRLPNKKIAIYGDSWTSDTHGLPWIRRLAELSKSDIHHVGIGSLTLPQIYTNCWDGYSADIYIIEGGLNDVYSNTPGDTFMSAIANFTTAIRSVNAVAEIYFITPPCVSRIDYLHQLLPPEFYRTCIWRLANRYNYHVINGLKWVDLYYPDDVHPSAETAPVIGNYIFSSLLTFGDAETHINQITTLGRQTTDIIFEMRNGVPYLILQTPTVDTATGLIELNYGTGLYGSQTVAYGTDDTTKRQYAFIFTGGFLGNNVVINPINADEQATSFTLYAGAYIELNISGWQMPAT